MIGSGLLRLGEVTLEIVDSIVAFPDRAGRYPKEARSLNRVHGDVPILIDKPTVVVERGENFLEGGEQLKLDSLPLVRRLHKPV